MFTQVSETETSLIFWAIKLIIFGCFRVFQTEQYREIFDQHEKLLKRVEMLNLSATSSCMFLITITYQKYRYQNDPVSENFTFNVPFQCLDKTKFIFLAAKSKC